MAYDRFITRHQGPRDHEIDTMLKTVGVASLDELIRQTLPPAILSDEPLNLSPAMSEYEYLAHIKKIASKNKIFRNYIGLGYYPTITPAVITRNILENPSWYTSYTPYQAEISQGRLEALLNFQTMVMDLTQMEVANASLLDEATAAAEAMIMAFNTRSRAKAKAGANQFFVDQNIFPQTMAVLQTRATPLNIELLTGNYASLEWTDKVFGALVQYPAADGKIRNYTAFAEKAHQTGALLTVVADLMSLALLEAPGTWGADVVVGSTQRFGVPMSYGGPHAAYFATREKFKRHIPGRIIGVSKDAHGKFALRMALQTREQHIKRERATSNICTAQALLATMAGMYAVYHGAEGIQRIALHIHSAAGLLATELEDLGCKQENKDFFDTLKIRLPNHFEAKDIQREALKKKVNLRYIDSKTIGISTDETTTKKDIKRLVKIFAKAFDTKYKKKPEWAEKHYFNASFERTTEFFTGDVFKWYRSETEMMRYIKKLERRDISLTQSMISLGSCTMKLNAAAEMLPITWAKFTDMHPFAPKEQAKGYHILFEELEKDLCQITGFEAISFQPNSGAAGEYSGLLAIRQYHKSRGESHRNVVLIPASAHGTNPASGVMAGMKVVVVPCDTNGNIDIEKLRQKAEENSQNLAAFMVTYPSTHGVFEANIKEMCQIVHQNGGQVYMDGANMNAQTGLTNPAIIGADVCHLNLHKTFAIPHGGGGPGVGPIGVAKHLVEFLPTHPIIRTGGASTKNTIAAAPYGSAGILPITHGYIKMLGSEGLTKVSKLAILNANYLASRLKDYFKILYTGESGRVAHEMILECRNFKSEAGISEADIAKRLMDYGFHAPTLSFPVHGTLMVEPTESESLQELDCFVETMISIYNEIQEVKNKTADAQDNVLKNAPHTATHIASDQWKHPYSRQKAAFPLKWIAENKFFTPVARIDDAYGDRNLFCSCAPLEEYRNQLFD